MVIGQLTIGNLRADHRMIGHRQDQAGNSMDLFSVLLNRPVYWGGEPAKVE